jgi:hypothetical protein
MSTSSPARAARPARPAPAARSAVGLAAVAGGGAALAGCLLPWAEIFAGLIGVSGIRGTNGRILAVAAVLAIAAGLWHLIRGGAVSRWAIGLLGAGVLTYAAYLLMRLTATMAALSQGGSSMFAARGGPGLWIVAAGGLVAFATLFLPGTSTPASSARRHRDEVAGPEAAGASPVGEGEARPQREIATGGV